MSELRGKRGEESKFERGKFRFHTGSTPISTSQPVSTQPFLNLINDNRLYAEIKIAGKTCIGLLDSGAQITVVGQDFESIINELKLTKYPTNLTIKTADGTAHSNNFRVDLPIQYAGQEKTIKSLFVPSVSRSIILGIDFWNSFKIQPFMCDAIECDKKINVSNVLDLSDCNAKILQDILKTMPFSNGGILSKTHLLKHTIDTGDAKPIKQVQYTMSPYIQKDVHAEIDRLLTIGAIIPCKASAWNNPMVAVRKPSGKIRLCLDARKLNDVTQKDAYPQQQINRILAQLTGTKVLSSIDFSDAYLQVELDEMSQPKTAFSISGKGHFVYCRMPFGLCNSGATLCRLVDQVVGCDMEPNVFVYLDDIIIATNTFDEHCRILKEIAIRLKAAGLTISSEKSRFCMRKLSYLGYVIDENGVHPDPDKISAVSNYPVPKTVKDVRRLMGLAGWYRRFIPNFSSITAPLSELTKKGKKFEWGEKAEAAMQTIKEILVSAPVLANPDYSKPFIIQSDASDIGMGGVLVQGEGDDERIIAFTSAKFSAAQRNYQTTERECLAVITAIEKFRPYIEGVSFTVVTDHASLLWLKNLKDPTGRLCRWSLRLQPYDIKFVHRKGSQMVVADAFSRAIETVDVHSFPTADDNWYNCLVNRVAEDGAKYPNFRIENSILYKNCEKGKRSFGYVSSWRIVVPSNKRNEVMDDCHIPPSSSHGGYHKTIDRVRRSYYWPGMDKDVRNYVRSCEVCKAIKPTNITQRAPMGNFREARQPWHIIYADFIGPLPKSKQGHCHILTVVDSFSKFVHAHPLRVATSKGLIQFLEKQIFLKFGVPEIIVTDNGVQFTSSEFKSFLEKYGTKQWAVSRYHPQANAAEAANKTIETSIRAYIRDDKDHRDWDKYLSQISCAMNTSLHTSTKFSPYFVNFGQSMALSGNSYSLTLSDDQTTENSTQDRLCKIREIVKKNLLKNYNDSKKRYDLRSRPIEYKVGDIVWKQNTILSNADKKIISKFCGSVKCKIKRKVGTCSYELEDLNGKSLGIFSTDKFKP